MKQKAILKGTVRDVILRSEKYNEVSINSQEKLDCAYIITIGDSPRLICQINRLYNCTKKIVVLCTRINSIIQNHRWEIVEFIYFDKSLHNRILTKQSSLNPTLHFNDQFDIPSKRNFAIEHAQEHNFAHIMLIDDDIVFRKSFVPSAIHLLNNGTDIACSYSLFYPDVSTLDKLYYTISGESPHISISGNAVVLKVGAHLGFFPYIYNEDWLFFWSSMTFGKAVVTPFQNVLQHYPRSGRETLVKMEQFGELITYMLFYEQHEADINTLLDRTYVDKCIINYRHDIMEMHKNKEFRSIITKALSALDKITADDIISFVSGYKQELFRHYEKRETL